MEYSFLDLALVTDETSIKDTLHKTIETAQHAEKLGFKRYWLAEHHNTPNVASSATTILITYVANNTTTIRVGSGGIMLPNHSTLAIAEQFGTMSELFDGRIDMGLGRAPGTDQMTAAFLRPDFHKNVQEFPKNVQIIQQLLSHANANSLIRAFPGEGTEVPVYILGSSTDSAKLAAALGLPYAFAAHFAPQAMEMAFKIYREQFVPSDGLQAPYTIACVNIIVDEHSENAHLYATSMYRMFLGIFNNERKPMAAPDASWKDNCSEQELNILQSMLSCSFIGNPDEVKSVLTDFTQRLQINELMMTCPIYSFENRMNSMQLASQILTAM